MVGLIFLGVFVILGIASFWIKGIDDMMENHPDYKGEDLFDEDLKDSDNTLIDGLDDKKDE